MNRNFEPRTAVPAEPLRVLVADDSLIIHRYLELSLAMIPGAVLAGRAFNGGDAITSVRDLRPDVLILDVEMPTTSGLDVLKAIPFDDARPLIFVLTLHNSRVLARHCRALGADRFFDKENEFAELLEVIAKHAANPSRCRRRLHLGDDELFHSASPAHPTTPPDL